MKSMSSLPGANWTVEYLSGSPSGLSAHDILVRATIVVGLQVLVSTALNVANSIFICAPLTSFSLGFMAYKNVCLDLSSRVIVLSGA